jgi:hypothetical protein
VQALLSRQYTQRAQCSNLNSSASGPSHPLAKSSRWPVVGVRRGQRRTCRLALRPPRGTARRPTAAGRGSAAQAAADAGRPAAAHCCSAGPLRRTRCSALMPWRGTARRPAAAVRGPPTLTPADSNPLLRVAAVARDGTRLAAAVLGSAAMRTTADAGEDASHRHCAISRGKTGIAAGPDALSRAHSRHSR